jgi:hypothetical protein
VVEFKFFAMRGYNRHNRLCCCLSTFERRGGQDTAHDHARVHVPRLRLKAELDSDAVLAGLAEQSSSLPNALTENGQVGSRNISKTRGPLPHTNGSARHEFGIRSFLVHPILRGERATTLILKPEKTICTAVAAQANRRGPGTRTARDLTDLRLRFNGLGVVESAIVDS